MGRQLQTVEQAKPLQFSLGALLQLSTIISVLLAIPLFGHVLLWLVIVPGAILGTLIVIQIPFFLPLILADRARRQRQESGSGYATSRRSTSLTTPATR